MTNSLEKIEECTTKAREALEAEFAHAFPMIFDLLNVQVLGVDVPPVEVSLTLDAALDAVQAGQGIQLLLNVAAETARELLRRGVPPQCIPPVAGLLTEICTAISRAGGEQIRAAQPPKILLDEDLRPPEPAYRHTAGRAIKRVRVRPGDEKYLRGLDSLLTALETDPSGPWGSKEVREFFGFHGLEVGDLIDLEDEHGATRRLGVSPRGLLQLWRRAGSQDG